MIQDCLHVTHYFTTFLLYYFFLSAVYYVLLMGARNVVFYNQLMSAWQTLISYHNIWKKKCPQQVLMCSFSQPSTKKGKILQSMYNMSMLCIGSLFFLRKCICCDLMLLFFIFANFFSLARREKYSFSSAWNKFKGPYKSALIAAHHCGLRPYICYRRNPRAAAAAACRRGKF